MDLESHQRPFSLAANGRATLRVQRRRGMPATGDALSASTHHWAAPERAAAVCPVAKPAPDGRASQASEAPLARVRATELLADAGDAGAKPPEVAATDALERTPLQPVGSCQRRRSSA
jgi:hypothetical protein